MRNIIYQEQDEGSQASDSDDVFSNNSLTKTENTYKNLIQTKGKLSLTFKAFLNKEFADRVQKVKRIYLQETYE